MDGVVPLGDSPEAGDGGQAVGGALVAGADLRGEKVKLESQPVMSTARRLINEELL